MYLLFDVGGTKTRVATSEDGISLNEVEKFDTPEKFDDFLQKLSSYKQNPYSVVAAGLPGVLSRDKKKLLRAPNLEEWINYPIGEKLENFFAAKVILENDAALAGLGEATYGAAKGKNIVAYLTISTGIGGARIVNGKIDAKTWGFEPGNHIIDADLSMWADSKSNLENTTIGSIESFISGMAIESRFGKKAREIKDREFWSEAENLLAVCLNNVISFWSPEIVVLGGGMVLEDAVSIDKTKDCLKKFYRVFPEIPEIKKAELGDESALYGALALLYKS